MPNFITDDARSLANRALRKAFSTMAKLFPWGDDARAARQGQKGQSGSEFCLALGRIAHAEHLKIFQTALEHIHQPVVAAGIGGNQQKAGVENVVAGIENDAFHYLVILKLDAHPQAGHHRRVVVKVQRVVGVVAVEGPDQEDGLGAFQVAVLRLAGIVQIQAEGSQLAARAAKKLFDGLGPGGFRNSLDGSIAILNDNPLAGGGSASRCGLCQAGLCGAMLYCFILYSKAL
jgi:hypothetical protein